jgi:hypothetical protein
MKVNFAPEAKEISSAFIICWLKRSSPDIGIKLSIKGAALIAAAISGVVKPEEIPAVQNFDMLHWLEIHPSRE